MGADERPAPAGRGVYDEVERARAALRHLGEFRPPGPAAIERFAGELDALLAAWRAEEERRARVWWRRLLRRVGSGR